MDTGLHFSGDSYCLLTCYTAQKTALQCKSHRRWSTDWWLPVKSSACPEQLLL